MVIIDNEIDIKEEALFLLESYTDYLYDILEKNIKNVPEQCMSKVLYLINTNE